MEITKTKIWSAFIQEQQNNIFVMPYILIFNVFKEMPSLNMYPDHDEKHMLFPKSVSFIRFDYWFKSVLVRYNILFLVHLRIKISPQRFSSLLRGIGHQLNFMKWLNNSKQIAIERIWYNVKNYFQFSSF